ncbi:MAG: electron transfer flavoprotein subunit beta/FixA family protein [Phycisphaerae bacterium]|jgi:electron transfer flavoprotein beta subunit|nr:electron transfer flavoprotein subunit beta/FixA family protein [Phycisphaerae bacterium]
MRIIVPIKQVPETNAVKMDETTGTMIREGVEAIINPLDLYAVELAIELREAETGGGEVIAISMGPPKAESAMREAIAMGVDSGVLISDKALAGSDTWSTSRVLAAAIGQMGRFDLVICGERATDGDTGQVGPGIAAWLDLPVASYVGKVESVGKKTCRVHRLVEDGYEVLEVQLPATLTVLKEVADPRLPTLRGKQKARKIDIPVLSVADLNVEADEVGLAGSPTRVVKIFRPQIARQCEKVPAADERAIDAAAERFVEFIKERQLV